MRESDIKELLAAYKSGAIDEAGVLNGLKLSPFRQTGEATVDLHRELRQGAPEVIYGESKTPRQIKEIVTVLLESGAKNIIVTRVDALKGEELKSAFERVFYYEYGKVAVINADYQVQYKGKVVIACAGTSDLGVAQEAFAVLKALGVEAELLVDIGVAGLHRVLAKLPALTCADVVIAIAGMEGALPSVIGGLVDAPVIAVPTSVGYGTNYGGLTALLAMLNSCSSGVTVVNVDSGFNAAYSAFKMIRMKNRNGDKTDGKN